MTAADHEKPFDGDHYCYCCPQLLQLLLFFYDISKTIVFWTNVLLILSNAITANFGQLCFITNKHIEMAARLICSVFRPFRPNPLESLVTNNQHDLIEKILWLQKRKPLKIENKLYRPSIQDILADTLDFVLSTSSRYRQRDYGHREEAAGSCRSQN